MELAKESSNLRVLMFPWLAHGHVLPFVELAKGLAEKQFHIYLCSTAINLESMKKSVISYDGSIELVELHLPSSAELPPHYHTTKNIPTHLIPALIMAFQMSAPAFSDIIANLKPDLLIYDGLQPWAAKAAASQGIPAVFFPVTGATTFAFGHHNYTYPAATGVDFPHKAIWLKEFEKREIRAAAKDIKVRDAGEGFLKGVFQLSKDIVVIKTCRALEGKYIDYLSTLCGKKLVTTGPMITFADNQETGGSEIMEWLSQKDAGSTVYISFGSENYLSEEQMRAIAKGLELLSNVNFIWVAREPAGAGAGAGAGSQPDALPEGFLERTKQRGLLVRGLAPQAAILAHPSVGGFVSHCGWGSVIESLYFGVPLVALPLKLDQPYHARLVVEAGVAVEIARDEDGGIDGNGVAEAVKEVLSEKRYKSKATEMSDKMQKESEDAFHQVAQELTKICNRK